MPGHEDHLFGGKVIGDHPGLPGVAGIIGDGEGELLAKNAARLVDFLNRHLGAALHLLAVGCVLSGHRADGGDGDVGKRHAGRKSRAQGQRV